MHYLYGFAGLILMSGCALISSGKDIEEHIQLMKTKNPIGCAYVMGSGTPPASRVDGGVLAAWGASMDAATMLDCVQALKGLP